MTTHLIKPIETRYKGHRFRSRTEARWAIVFDTLGIQYEYEPEGFDLSGIPHVGEFLPAGDRWYLPDFFLPRLGCYMEIKPLMTPVDDVAITKCFLLSQEKEVLITFGSPGVNSYRIVSCNSGRQLKDFWQHRHINIAFEAAREARF